MDKVPDSLIFRYNEDQTISTLDPAFIANQSEIWVVNQIFNGLVELDSTLSPVPSLATRWEVSDSARVYKFYLRKGVRFHVQDTSLHAQTQWVTAKDVAFSFKRLVNPATASPAAWIFNDKVPENPQTWDHHFEATSDSVFTLRLLKPAPAMLKLLGTPFCSIVSESAVKKWGPSFGRNPVGTGPFYLKIWVNDVRMVLRKNPLYFESDSAGNRLPYLEAVNIDMLKNKQTAFMKFVAGEFDFFNGLEGSFKDELLTRDGQLSKKYQGKLRMLRKPFLNTEFLGIYLDSAVNNQIPHALRNPKVRHALSAAIDRKALIRYLRNGIGTPGEQGFVPPSLMQGNPVKGVSYHPSLAAQLLSEAGYPNGKGIPPLQLTTTSDYLDMMVFIQRAWQVIGVKANIDIQPGGMLRQKRNKGQLMIYRGSWIADYTDPENYLAVFYSSYFSPNGPNYTHFQHADYDPLYQQLVSESQIQRRNSLSHQADSLAMSMHPVIVLYYDESLRLYHPHIKGFTNDAGNRLRLKWVKKE